MTDRELLELAAKAAGIIPALYETQNGMVWEPDKKVWRRAWNPLTDDGDALRLAVKLGIDVDCDIAGGQTTVNGDFGWVSEMHSPDPYASTRRAISCAAAEIGRAMP